LPCQQGDGAACGEGEVAFVGGEVGAAGDKIAGHSDAEVAFFAVQAAAVEALVGAVGAGFVWCLGAVVGDAEGVLGLPAVGDFVAIVIRAVGVGGGGDVDVAQGGHFDVVFGAGAAAGDVDVLPLVIVTLSPLRLLPMVSVRQVSSRVVRVVVLNVPLDLLCRSL